MPASLPLPRYSGAPKRQCHTILGAVALIAILLTGAASAASPPPRFELLLLGTGYPRPDPNHAGPSTAVLVGDRLFVVDAGRGVVLRLAATDVKLKQLAAVFLTHLHSDHTAGLPDLFNSSWQFGRGTPLQLYGPPGIERLAAAMLEFFAEDTHIRRDLVEMHPAAGATIEPHVVREGTVFSDPDVAITAFEVDHRPVEKAFGYRFESAGRILVISGDTRPTPNLVKYARGADVLVLEAYLPEWFDKVDKPEVATRLKSYHTSAEEAGQMAAEAQVPTLVLTHLIPADQEKAFIDRAGRYFHGRLIAGRDLFRMEVSRRTEN
jgi:ribonuclease BN (tRNA processing enzyme)